MLLSIQFPLADARRFLDQAERLGPVWPLPTPDSEFVRFFGAIRERRGGGLAGWIGEDRICKADRAVAFTSPSSLLNGRTGTRIAFRRFYFDGWAVGKYETGLSLPLDSFSGQFQDLGSSFLHHPVRIRDARGTRFDSELAEAGKHLAHLYLMASVPTKSAIPEKDRWQIRAGTALLFSELHEGEPLAIPKDARQVDLPGWPASVRLFHYGIPYRGGTIYMWILQRGYSAAEASMARTLRLSLLRLHAEHECLRLILQSIAKKDIQITRGTAQSDDLQWYLDKAIKRITNFEDKTGGVNEDIAQVARQSINVIRPGQLDQLLENVGDYRRYLRQNIEKYAKQDASVTNNYYGNVYNVSDVRDSNVNLGSTLTGVTQNVGSIPGIDPSARHELKRLIEQLNVSLQKASREDAEAAEALAEIAKDLVEYLSKDKPNKPRIKITLEGLKQAAEDIGKVLPEVLPVALQIVSFVSKTFGLGGT